MDLFKIKNINNIDFQSLEKDNFCDEVVVQTNIYEKNNVEKIIELSFKLKNSYIKRNVIDIIYNYSTEEVEKVNCDFCLRDSLISNYHNCGHAIYLLEKYNAMEIEGSYSKYDIDAMFSALREEKVKDERNKKAKEMSKLLERLEKSLNSGLEISSFKQVHLLPIINCHTVDGEEYNTTIELKIGKDKYYIIKDISEFLKRIKNKELYSYGKALQVNHSMNSFDDSSRNCIDVLMGYTINSYMENCKYKEISPKAIQSIIEGYVNNKVIINNEECFVSLAMYDPQISIKNNKLVFDDCDNINLVCGNEYDFIVKDNVVYKLNCDYEMRVLIRFLLVYKNFDMELIKDEFAKKIVSRFTDEIEFDDEFREEYSIKELNIEAYFDYTDDYEIVLDTKYYLEDKEISEKDVKENNFISKKYIKYQTLINNLGFKDNIIHDTDAVGNFLTADLNGLRECCEIFLSNNIKETTVKKMPKISSNISYNNNTLDICFANFSFSNEELYKIIQGMKKKVKYIKLNKDVIVKTDEETTKQLLSIVEEFNLEETKLNEIQEIPLYQGLKLAGDNNHFGDIKIDDKVKEMLKEIANYKDANYEVPSEVKKVLRQYQVNAFNWLKTLVKYNFCGILADDMGLGKTLEIISLILSDEVNKPSLIVSPKSLIYNWENEFKKWAPNTKVKVVAGYADDRKKIIEEYDENEKIIFISSYDSLKNDLEHYNNYNFRFCILDEAQFIKNHATLKAQSVKQIKSEVRFVLTGTPIENTVVDLWSLFDFLMPNYLYNYSSFKNSYEKEIIGKKDGNMIKKLVKKITPFILRRTKKEVLDDLPDKLETVRYAQMGTSQQKIYEAQLLKTRTMLEGKTSKIEILAAMMRLRQICVHPKMFLEDYNGDSCKVDLALDLIEDLVDNNHKILVFSQFTSLFDIMAERLKEKGIDYFVLTGKTPAFLRVEMAETFNNKKSSQKVFLISLKAGGTGLNLVGADTVIQMDPWWNVAAENQASDRAHRIGQKNVVQVIKLICASTIEQKVLDLQEMKQDIVNQVIADNDENIVKLTDSDLKYLLN